MLSTTMITHNISTAEPTLNFGSRLPTGLTVLTGPNTSGFDRFVTQLAEAVAEGEAFFGTPAEKGDVILLALDYGRERLNLMHDFLSYRSRPNRAIHLHVEAPMFGKDLTEQITAWATKNPTLKLIVIDSYKQVRRDNSDGTGDFMSVQTHLQILNDLAKHTDTTIVLIDRHPPKNAETPYTDELLDGHSSVSNALFIGRGSADAYLHTTVIHRGQSDFDEVEVDLKYDQQAGRWTARKRC